MLVLPPVGAGLGLGEQCEAVGWWEHWGWLPLPAAPTHPGSIVSLTPDYTPQALHRCRCPSNVSSPQQP